MLIQVLKCKIHRATVTDADLDYEGSLTIDRSLMERAGLLPYETIAVWNVTNGQRFETYVIEGERDSGAICVNGAAAHLATQGDIVIIAAFAFVAAPEGFTPALEPRVVRVDDTNRPLADDGPESAS